VGWLLDAGSRVAKLFQHKYDISHIPATNTPRHTVSHSTRYTTFFNRRRSKADQPRSRTLHHHLVACRPALHQPSLVFACSPITEKHATLYHSLYHYRPKLVTNLCLYRLSPSPQCLYYNKSGVYAFFYWVLGVWVIRNVRTTRKKGVWKCTPWACKVTLHGI